MSRTVTRVEIGGPAGRLVGLLARPDREARFAAVVSHPHPLFGGTMDNKVAYRMARALEDAGGVVLRYNFRGAGGSDGAHDHGIGEQDDLRAAMAFLRREAGPGLPMVLAGFSFGSAMSARVGVADADVGALLLVGAPVATYSFAELAACRKPVAFVHGERDEHGPLPQLEALVASLACPKRLVVLAGAGHFFDDSQDELREVIQRLVREGHLGPRLAPASGAGNLEPSC